MGTHYQVLGVASDAPHDEIKRAYHRLARRHHPDAHSQASAVIQDSARRTMVDINAAWAVLGDPARRRRYDAELVPPRQQTAAAAAADSSTVVGDSDESRRGSAFPDWFDPDDEVPAAHLTEDVRDGPAGRGELLVFVPVGLAALAVVTFAFAMVVQWPLLFVLSFALVPLAVVTFLAAPFVAMAVRVRTPPAPD